MKYVVQPAQMWGITEGAGNRAMASTVLRGLAAFLLVAGTGAAQAGFANPLGGVVAAGTASIVNTTPIQTDINQSSNKAVINWSSFNIAPNETTNFHQPSVSSATLNRIGDANPSQILGKLNANGQLMLVNQNGMFFGKNSQVNAAGLTATTADITNSNFMAGKYAFNKAGNPDAQIVNNGKITTPNGGYVALVAPTVENKGTITASAGKVALGGSDVFTLDPTGGDLISFALPSGVTRSGPNGHNAEVDNSGNIYADQGKVLLTAQAANHLIDSVVNMDGVIRAKSASGKQGVITLEGDNVDVAGDMDVSGNGNANGGTINAHARENMSFSGDAKAEGGSSGGNGGNIAFTGDKHLSLGGTASAGSSHGHAGTVSFLGGNTFDINSPEEYSIDYSLDKGGTVNVGAYKTVNYNYDLNDDGSGSGNGPKNVLNFADRDHDGNLTVNLNTKIHHEPNGTITGDATKVNVGSQASIQQGVDVASEDGAKIDVANGTYNENVNVYKNNINLDPVGPKPVINGYVNVTADDDTVSGFNIKGGSLGGHMVGVNVNDGNGANIHDNIIGAKGSGTGVRVLDSADVDVSHNTINNAQTGVYADDSYSLDVDHNNITASNGVNINDSTKAKVVDNTIKGNGSSTGVGIALRDDSDNAQVLDNDISWYKTGVLVDDSNNAKLSDNDISHVTDGVDANSSDNLKMDHNHITGQSAGAGNGISLNNSHNAKLTNNTANNVLHKLSNTGGSTITTQTGNNF